jgi:hypothetical protein
MKPRILWLAAAMAAATTPALSAEPKLPADGWTSWEVPAPDGAPFWCCWNSWNDRSSTREPCKLDARSNGFGTRRDHETTDTAKVYVRTAGGKVDRLQVLAAACPVQTLTPVTELAQVSPEDSVSFLTALAKQGGTDAVTREPLAQQALAGLAQHRLDRAGAELTTFARADSRAETRKWAVFWLAQRAQPGAEQTLSAALREDKDDEVREHAVFALSQLPADRATRALIAAAEDRSLSRAQRKRAVFWLAHSDSEGAQLDLEKVLTRK